MGPYAGRFILPVMMSLSEFRDSQGCPLVLHAAEY